MSGRIALMVRGLPSIGIDEAVERLGKYYAKVPSDQKVFHTSPSFTGLSSQNAISFLNNKTGDFTGGGGLNSQVITDLRQLQRDFNDYVQTNQGIYTNSPTTTSRAKLYKRVGFKDVPDGGQVLDSRRISPDDLPYVKAIDAAVMPKPFKDVLEVGGLPVFIKGEDGVVAASKINRNTILDALRGYRNSSDILGIEASGVLDEKRIKRRMAKFNEFGEYTDRPIEQPPALSNQSFQGIIDDYDVIPF